MQVYKIIGGISYKFIDQIKFTKYYQYKISMK